MRARSARDSPAASSGRWQLAARGIRREATSRLALRQRQKATTKGLPSPATSQRRAGRNREARFPDRTGADGPGDWRPGFGGESAGMIDHVISEVADGVQTVRFDRIEAKNALTAAMCEAAADAIAFGESSSQGARHRHHRRPRHLHHRPRPRRTRQFRRGRRDRRERHPPAEDAGHGRQADDRGGRRAGVRLRHDASSSSATTSSPANGRASRRRSSTSACRPMRRRACSRRGCSATIAPSR